MGRSMVRSNAEDVIALKKGCQSQSTILREPNLRRSRHSSRTISSSRELSPCVHLSTHVSHVCSSSTNVQGRVQSKTIITSV